eukprot:COSAG02_NODE_44_length_45948_cov_81.673493_23_plen_89_part_00
MSGRRTRQTEPSPSSPAPDAGEQEEVGADLTWVLSAVESLTAQVQAVAKQQEEQHAGLETYRVGAFPLTDDLYVIISSIPFQLIKSEA